MPHLQKNKKEKIKGENISLSNEENNIKEKPKRTPIYVRSLCERAEEWNDIEELVMQYKKAFEKDRKITEEEIKESKAAAEELLHRFSPLFKKYQILIKTCQIDFKDYEMKRFILTFIKDPQAKAALKRKYQTIKDKQQIVREFNFIKETYGQQSDVAILSDMRTCMLTLAKRYKQIGYNFCSYVYNSYSYEFSRAIKKYTNDPISIVYKTWAYEEYMQAYVDTASEDFLDDKTYEDALGIPDMSWINGDTCSELFASLEPLDRKIIVKYYMEHYSDRQIAKELSLHVNTTNLRRRAIISKLAQSLGYDIATIKRSRNSGKNRLRF